MSVSDDTKNPEAEAREAFQAARKAARDACLAEVNASYEKHRCKPAVVQQFVNGQQASLSIELIDA